MYSDKIRQYSHLKTELYDNTIKEFCSYPNKSWVLILLTTYSNTRVSVSLVWMMSWSSTMLACFSPFNREAGRYSEQRYVITGNNLLISFFYCTATSSDEIYLFSHFLCQYRYGLSPYVWNIYSADVEWRFL